MSQLYDWVSDILFFLVLMSLLEALLPSKKYARYIRFFAGIVLILTAAQPFLSGLGIAQEMDRYFGEFTFQTEARDIRRDVLGIEEERRQRLFSDGEAAAEAEVEAMAREAGLVPVHTEVVIEKNAENADYGTVVRVAASVRRDGGEAAGAGSGEFSEAAGVGSGEFSGAAGAAAAGDGKAAVPPVTIRIEPVEIGPHDEKTADDLAELKRKVERYYELEPENVEIQLERR